MHPLKQILYRTDISFLRIIADLWHVSDNVTDRAGMVEILLRKMSDAEILRNLLDDLGEECRDALLYLADKGREKSSVYSSKFGHIRVIGVAQMRREKPWTHPVSSAEELWYTGLIFKENDPDTLEECICISDDIREALSACCSGKKTVEIEPSRPFFVRPASPTEISFTEAAEDSIADLSTLLLACIRSEKDPAILTEAYGSPFIAFCRKMLDSMKIAGQDGSVDIEKARGLMIGSRYAALFDFTKTWLESETYDEFSENVRKFRVIKKIPYQHGSVRSKIIRFLCRLKENQWWSVSGFVSAVQSEDELFLRTEITDDSWDIRDDRGNSLTGIGSWHQLEGAYIQFLLAGPLHFLGLIDAGYSGSEKTEITGFRILSRGGKILRSLLEPELKDDPHGLPNPEKGLPTITADGRITCRNDVPRMFRYQALRSCGVEKLDRPRIIFRVTPESLAEAESNGLDTESFLTLLKRFCKNGVPPTLEATIRGWHDSRLTALIYDATILSLPSADSAKIVTEDARLSAYVLQILNDTTMIIQKKGIDKIRQKLMESKIFVSIDIKE